MLANAKLRSKLLISFLVVLTLMVIASALAYKEFVTIGHEIEEYAQTVDSASKASYIETLFLKLRTHAREYAATGQIEDSKAVNRIGVNLLAKLEEAIAAEKNPNNLKLLKVMQKDAELYKNNHPGFRECRLNPNC